MSEDLRYQLNFIENELEKDPENEELLKLKEDLLEMINLSNEIEEDKQPKVNKRKSVEVSGKVEEKRDEGEVKESLFSIGDYVIVKSKDEKNRFVEGRIETIAGDFCTVLLTESGKIEKILTKHLKKKEEKKTKEENNKHEIVIINNKKRPNNENHKGSVEKPKRQTLEEHRAKKEAEHAAKQSTWLDFKKTVKKRIPTAGVIKKKPF
jgi:survival-of-motor-neuron-related-splicing factor 30